jgi:hypothetical protein
MLLFFVAEWVTSQRLRDLGDKTAVGLCYRVAEVVDVVRDRTGSIFEDVRAITMDRVNRWRDVAKR